ncbi:DUF3784 domain-containing protein [Clostridium senegalense]|uniref:DUF3784 domain-containing protein n=1 Tax=Clostridium senegalense TaxID=1465809 RepID=UPI001C11CBB2|nr:DUF3784 domain-containing protein [Clostridium senegalense]MBU5228010.1 DUF3784 domain-containing protein [Clostridium senegalense]
MIVKILIIIPFIILGIFLIAGFNAMPKEQQQKYDVISLCKFMGKLMFMISFCMIFLLLSDTFIMKALGFTLLLVSIIFSVVYLNTRNSFKK